MGVTVSVEVDLVDSKALEPDRALGRVSLLVGRSPEVYFLCQSEVLDLVFYR